MHCWVPHFHLTFAVLPVESISSLDNLLQYLSAKTARRTVFILQHELYPGVILAYCDYLAIHTFPDLAIIRICTYSVICIYQC